MELKRRAAVRNGTCKMKIPTETFVLKYEKAHEDVHHKKLKIWNYGSIGPSKFFDITSIIDEGKHILGKVRIDDTFENLKLGEIYEYDNKRAKKTEADEHISDALLFVGYGQ
ncbi:hypothetical protein C2845_PM09G01720 [Panicum miliaceum]|uniref:Uncharacterized protein n=1 Tax=Panicum miliaceum TaxID=4540 RepID=A0A3L6S442_PANMI|nr:hypothetical protein C2845_PM09G01720 [Panicum miliaceum]